MATKPTNLPRWASDVSADVVEPTSGKKDVGWAAQERPPAQYMNWLQELTYDWLKWLDDGYLRRASLTDNTPVLATCDRDGRARSYLGPEGYWMGSAIQEQHRWGPVNDTADIGSSDPISPHQGAAVVLDANTQPRIMTPTGASPSCGAPMMRLRVLNAATSARVAIRHESGTQFPIGDLDNNMIVMEWRMYTDTVGASNTEIWGGLHEGASTTFANYDNNAVNAFAMFRRLSGEANWHCLVSDGGGTETDTDSGVAIAANTWFTFRIELHGANTPVGVNNSTSPVTRFFIDGAEVAEVTDGNVPDGSGASDYLGMFIGHAADSTGPAADADLFVAPVRIAWTEVLSPNVPA